MVVDQLWRAAALAEMIDEAGLVPEIGRTDEDTPLVRTAVDPSLTAIAAEWTRGAVKTVPPRWLPGPRELRAWTLAAGTPKAITICWAWIHTRPTPIRRSRRP